MQGSMQQGGVVQGRTQSSGLAAAGSIPGQSQQQTFQQGPGLFRLAAASIPKGTLVSPATETLAQRFEACLHASTSVGPEAQVPLPGQVPLPCQGQTAMVTARYPLAACMDGAAADTPAVARESPFPARPEEGDAESLSLQTVPVSTQDTPSTNAPGGALDARAPDAPTSDGRAIMAAEALAQLLEIHAVRVLANEAACKGHAGGELMICLPDSQQFAATPTAGLQGVSAMFLSRSNSGWILRLQAGHAVDPAGASVTSAALKKLSERFWARGLGKLEIQGACDADGERGDAHTGNLRPVARRLTGTLQTP